MSLGLAGLQQTTPTLQGMDATTPTMQGIAAPQPSATQQENKNVWYGKDTSGAIVPWGEFNVNQNADYQGILNSAYLKPQPKSDYTLGNPFGQKKYATQAWSNTGASDLFGGTPSVKYAEVPSGINMGNMFPAKKVDPLAQFKTPFAQHNSLINFKDANLSAAMQALNDKSMASLAPVSKTLAPPSQWDNMYGGLRNKQTPKDASVTNSFGWAPLSRLSDDNLRQTALADVAKQYGMSVEDLSFNYGKYDKAYRSLYDPVGGNWQDLMNSPIRDKQLAAVRSYSGQNDDFFNKTNLLAKNGVFGNTSAEYFALHDPNIVRDGYNGTNIAGGGKGFSSIANHNPYSREDWTDYLHNNKPIWQQSAEERAAAESDMAHYKDLRGKTQEQGGVFDLGRESGYVPQWSKRGGGYMWKDSAEGNRFNITQNALGSAGKNYTDANLDPNTALQSQLQYIAPKKKRGFLGGLGKILGPIATIASVIPGPWQLPAVLYNGVSGIANGNVLGGLASLAGASFIPTGAMGTTGSMVGTGAGVGAGATTSIASNVVSKLVGEGMSLATANALVKGGLGAMGGFNSGNAGIGALTGGLSAYAPQLASTLAPSIGKLPAASLVNAGMGALGGSGSGNTGLGAVLGAASPFVSTALGNTSTAKIGTQLGSRAIMTKAQLDKQKAAMKKAMAQQGVA